MHPNLKPRSLSYLLKHYFADLLNPANVKSMDFSVRWRFQIAITAACGNLRFTNGMHYRPILSILVPHPGALSDTSALRLSFRFPCQFSCAVKIVAGYSGRTLQVKNNF